MAAGGQGSLGVDTVNRSGARATPCACTPSSPSRTSHRSHGSVAGALAHPVALVTVEVLEWNGSLVASDPRGPHPLTRPYRRAAPTPTRRATSLRVMRGRSALAGRSASSFGLVPSRPPDPTRVRAGPTAAGPGSWHGSVPIGGTGCVASRRVAYVGWAALGSVSAAVAVDGAGGPRHRRDRCRRQSPGLFAPCRPSPPPARRPPCGSGRRLGVRHRRGSTGLRPRRPPGAAAQRVSRTLSALVLAASPKTS